MIPKSDFFGAVPPARGHDAVAVHPQLPTAALNPTKDFSAIVSQAVAKRTEPPRTSETVPAKLPITLENSDGTSAAVALDGKDGIPTASVSRGENLPEIGFHLVAKAVLPPTTSATPKGKSRQAASAAATKGDSIDSSMLSGIIALLVPPEAVKPQVQSTAPSQAHRDDLTVDAEAEDRTATRASKAVFHSRLAAPLEEAASEEDAPRKNSGLTDARPPAHGEGSRPAKVGSTSLNTKPEESKTLPPLTEPANSSDLPPKASIPAPGQPTPPPAIAAGNVSNAPPPTPSSPGNGPPTALQQVDSKNVPKEALKGGDPPAAADGTPAALPKQRMKFAGEKNDIAGRAVQNLPNASGADDSTSNSGNKARTHVEPSAAKLPRESFFPTSLSYFATNPSLIDGLQGKPMEGAQAANTAAAQVERVAHMVSQEIFMVRQSGANALAVSLKVDSHTELFLQLTNHDGQIQASLRCERGNVEGLDSHWAELQQSLARQNVQLMPFENRPLSSGAQASTPSSGNIASLPFNQSSQERQPQFRDSQAETPMAPASVKGRVPGKTRTSNRPQQGWEKWA